MDCSSTTLCDAAAAGDLQTLRDIHAAGGDINLGDYDKRTAIHLAASDGLLDVVTLLVEELGAVHSPVDRWGATPLDDALRHGHKDVFAYLKSVGAKRGKVDCSSTALCDAASQGHLQALRDIHEAGGDINLGDYDKRTAIHLAASEGKLDVVMLLVELGADCSPIDRWGGTPLDDALRHDHMKVVEYLTAKEASRGVVAPQRDKPRAQSATKMAVDVSSSALLAAASKSDMKTLRAIVHEGGNINLGDYNMRTALHMVASSGRIVMVKAIIEELAADHSPVDCFGNTPIDDAIRHSHEEVVEYLMRRGAVRKLKHGASHDTLVINMESLHLAPRIVVMDDATEAAIKSLRDIRSAGVDINGADTQMRTVLHQAAIEGNAMVVRALIEHFDANHSPVDSHGSTPLDKALHHRHVEVANYLVSRGAISNSQRRWRWALLRLAATCRMRAARARHESSRWRQANAKQAYQADKYEERRLVERKTALSRGNTTRSKEAEARRVTFHRAPSQQILTTVGHDTFSSGAQLSAWLNESGVSTSGWGINGAKSAADLLQELRGNESTLIRQVFRRVGGESGVELIGGKAFRRLRVMKIILRPCEGATRHLACYQQKMADGQVRKRNVLLSEKMIANEDPLPAAVRGVIEELGTFNLDRSTVQVKADSLLVWDELIDSPSYPSLTTQYTLHQVEVIVPGLPNEPFSTTEGKKEHFWEWRVDSADDLRRKLSV